MKLPEAHPVNVPVVTEETISHRRESFFENFRNDFLKTTDKDRKTRLAGLLSSLTDERHTKEELVRGISKIKADLGALLKDPAVHILPYGVKAELIRDVNRMEREAVAEEKINVAEIHRIQKDFFNKLMTGVAGRFIPERGESKTEKLLSIAKFLADEELVRQMQEDLNEENKQRKA
ncbi:MAG: hypothetical protein ABIA76_00575 [Candidatus Diapherotrites archaeon]